MNAPYGVVEDGFGAAWDRCKPDCALHVVRPGKVQCGPCDAAEDAEHIARALADGACPRCSRGSWAVWHGDECQLERP